MGWRSTINGSNSSRNCSLSSIETLEGARRPSFDSESYASEEFDFPEREPILSHGRYPTHLNKRRILGITDPYRYKVPNRVMRYLCMGLAGSMLVLIFSLMQASANSDKAVLEMGKKKLTPPMPWKAFPALRRYYGGLRSIVNKEDNIPEFPRPTGEDLKEVQIDMESMQTFAQSTAYDPYPDYRSKDYIREFGEVMKCFLDDKETVEPPMIHVYQGVPKGMPESAYGSHDVLGLNGSNCVDRYGRYGPYGYGYGKQRGGVGAGIEGEREGADTVWKASGQIDYSKINWAEAQKRCAKKNAHRFNTIDSKAVQSDITSIHGRGKDQENDIVRVIADQPAYTNSTASQFNNISQATHDDLSSTNPKVGAQKLPRQAIVIRTWDDFNYMDEHVLYLRSIINELALASSGEFDVHFLIQVKNNDLPIWADEDTYQQTLESSLPPEFHGLGTLWSERQMQYIYGGVHEAHHRAEFPEIIGWYRSAHMPLQYFSKLHPEYEFVWNWEMDIRYIGNWYDLFSKVGSWSARQPRKGLWERNNRFYIPNIHGSWEDFVHMVRVQSDMPAKENPSKWANMGPDGVRQDPEEYDGKPVWGPKWPEGDLASAPFHDDPDPPMAYEKDKYEWGVGEEADLILFNPIFDPARTDWTLADDFNGYNLREDGTQGSIPPRRTAVVASGRFSRRLLDRMHREVALRKHTMFTEMFPPTMALHHGLKAVFAPHPVFMDHDWPMKYLAATFNPGPNGESGRHKMAVFGDCCQHNLLGSTWHYNAEFAPMLWKRWWGLRVEDKGGEAEELQGEGRMCLPPMLFHPIKNVTLPVEMPQKLDPDYIDSNNAVLGMGLDE